MEVSLMSSLRSSRLGRLLVPTAVVVAAGAVVVAPTALAAPAPRTAAASQPVLVSILTPHKGAVAGINGVNFTVDLVLDAAAGHNTDLVGKPRFFPSDSASFKAGVNPAIPGLVVALSTNPTRTNLANLFQLTGVSTVNGAKEITTSWLVGRAIFGSNVDSTLTVYVVKGTAPSSVPQDTPSNLLSAVATTTFHISGASSSSSAATTTPSSTTSAKGAMKVAIKGYAYAPQALTVSPGTTVTWTNYDNDAHTVTSKTSAWTTSGTLHNGATFSYKFTQKGTYSYYCGFHPFMVATVVVK